MHPVSSGLVSRYLKVRRVDFVIQIAQEGRLSPTENGVAVGPQQHMHLGSSSGANARRVTVEERERQDLELKHEYKSESHLSFLELMSMLSQYRVS